LTVHLLPPDYEDLAAEAVRHFWRTRSAGASTAQAGTRGAVISGRNMDGFIDLVRAIAKHCGLPESAVISNKSGVVLPGYFRATKNWDVLIIHRKRLLAVLEFKSQVGSFGNNFNNRSEEVLGSAADLWIAHQRGAFQSGDQPPMLAAEDGVLPLLHPELQADPRPPFLGWVMLLEDCAGSNTPVRCDEPNYPVFPEFHGASYAERYRLLCERLVERRLYSAAALVLSAGEDAGYRGLSEATALRTVCAALGAAIAAA
jgi:hypothetical protein